MSAGTDNGDGTWTLGSDDLEGLTITPADDFSGSFDLGVTAKSADGEDVATTSGSITVDVAGVADAATLDVADASGSEDTAIALNIDAGLTDASENLTITISDVPDGATLSAGTDNGDGTWTLSSGDLEGLSVTPPDDYSGSFDLQITASTQDGIDIATVSDTVMVNVVGVADMPLLDVEDASGSAREAISLDIDAGLTDASEVLSITIAGVPRGAELSAGTENSDGTWTLSSEDLEGLTISLDDKCARSFDLTVTATSVDGDDSSSVTQTLSVDLDNTRNETVYGSHGRDYITTGAGDDYIYAKGGDDRISSGAGDDTIYAGSGKDSIDGGDGDDYIDGGRHNDTVKGGAGDDTILGGSGEDTLEGGEGTDRLYGGSSDDVLIGSGDDRLYGQDGKDEIRYSVDLTAEGTGLVDGGSSCDTLKLYLTADQLSGDGVLSALLDLQGHIGSREGGSLTLDALGVEVDNIEKLEVYVDGERYEPTAETPDTPELSVSDATGAEDNAIALDIAASLSDPLEVLVVTVSGVPDGATLSAGTNNGNGTWTLAAGDQIGRAHV